MVKLYDILDITSLVANIIDGNIRVQRHPKFPLRIYNYTHQCMYNGVWDNETMTCRGLIVDDDDNVIARPFRKFFNYGQAGAPLLDLNAPVVVTSKEDGSLGIGYMWEGEPFIATRGSFTSEQADWASLHLCQVYPDVAAFPEGYTPLFEIVYPENRIVLNYGDEENLILLAEVEIETGQSRPPSGDWYPGPIAESYSQYGTLAKVLAAPPRPNAEGFVVHDLATDERIKIKQDDYIALHRVLTRTNARTIWTYMAVNACRRLIAEPKHWPSRLGISAETAQQILAVGPDWMAALLERVPDEFYAYVRSTVHSIQAQVVETVEMLWPQAQELKGLERKEAAVRLAGNPDAGLLWQLYDGKDITVPIWKRVYPEADNPWMAVSEDVA